ncbi:MAG: nucleotide exchange factor GrpE [Actinomycetota bacterium]
MAEKDRHQEEDRPRVKVTDKRRVRADAEGAGEVPSAGQSPPDPNVGDAGSAGQSPPNPRSASAAAGAQTATDVDAARRQADEYREHLQRLQAEFDNYRKRVLKEQTRAVEMAAEPLIRKLLEVLDEFDLALMAAEQRPDFDKFLHGVELVYAKVGDILRSEGLERIEATGKPFDPTLHEALMQSGEADGEPVVADVLRPGYTLRGHVIRPAGVKVTRR